MNSTATTRRTTSAVVAVVAVFAMAACGTDVSAPTQDIGRNHTQQQKAPTQPPRTTDRRIDFGDEMGTADHQEKKASPATSGTHNRMDFRDRGF